MALFVINYSHLIQINLECKINSISFELLLPRKTDVVYHFSLPTFTTSTLNQHGKIFDQHKNMWQWTTCQVMSAGNDDIFISENANE